MSQVEPERAKWPVVQRNASPDRALGTRHLRSMLSTAELAQRPSRPPDYAAENRALIALAQVMATSPESVLQRLADTALALCRADSAGLSLLEESDQRSNLLARHRWAVVASPKRWHAAGLRPMRHGPGPERRANVFTPRTRFSILRRGPALA